MFNRKRLERAMKAQQEMNSKEVYDKFEEESAPLSRREAAKLSVAAVLFFVPICLVVLLLLCLVCLPFLFF